MTHVEYWQRLNEIKLLTRELGEAWTRFDDGMHVIRLHLAHAQEILQGGGQFPEDPARLAQQARLVEGK